MSDTHKKSETNQQASDFHTTEGSVNGSLTDQHYAMVDRFYQAALTNGGKDNGVPGERNYHPGYYAAFVLDPDGNNIEAVYHGEAKRSVESVEIRF